MLKKRRTRRGHPTADATREKIAAALRASWASGRHAGSRTLNQNRQPALTRDTLTPEHVRARCTVDPHSQCWTWTGPTGRTGQPTMKLGTRAARFDIAPRLYLYRTTRGPLADGSSLAAACGTVLCINPDHQRIRTHSEIGCAHIDEARRRGMQQRDKAILAAVDRAIPAHLPADLRAEMRQELTVYALQQPRPIRALRTETVAAIVRELRRQLDPYRPDLSLDAPDHNGLTLGRKLGLY